MNSNQKDKYIADIGDYLKVFACTAVMLQPILGLVLKLHPSIQIQSFVGVLYNLVKYTAPAFIFGILYTTIRTNPNSNWQNYGSYLGKQWHALLVPTIWWTLIYLIGMPWVQQHEHFHNFKSFLWQFVNGNAAPHLWYNTMMLQFIILMPLFWQLGHFVDNNPRRGKIIALSTSLLYLGWLIFYDIEVFHGPHQNNWYLLDRIFISFIIYGVFGVLAWKFAPQVNRWLRKHWKLMVGFVILMFCWTNLELFHFGFPVSLANAPYYKVSMTLYSLGIIALVATLCIRHMEVKKDRLLKGFHFLATYAYRAYLSNIFWTQIIWRITPVQIHTVHPILSLFVNWIITWILSFASAIGLHVGWSKLKSLVGVK